MPPLLGRPVRADTVPCIAMTPSIATVSPRLTFRAWGATDQGRVRSSNEDHLAVDALHQVCIVADGMGGHRGGEVASRVVVDDVMDSVRRGYTAGPFALSPGTSTAGNLLRSAVHAANERLLDMAARDERYSGMGTTVVVALIRGAVLTVAHAGDSRLYLRDRHGLRVVTVDDSWMANVLAMDPEADPVQLARHPLRNVLTNVVGGRLEMEVHVQDLPLVGGERIVLTTDGVHGVLQPERLAQIVDEYPASEVPAALIAAALDRGSRDNCTAVVGEFGAGSRHT